MRRFVCLLLALFLLCAAVPSPSFAASTISVPVEGEKLYSAAFEMLDLVNAERTARGIPALTMDPELLELAMTRAFETAVYWSHTRPDGTDCYSLSSRIYAENNAMKGFSKPGYPEDATKKAMKQLMDSQGHKENILSTRFHSIGIGVVVLDRNIYWVQDFDVSSAASRAAQKADVKAKVNVKTLADPAYFSPEFRIGNANLQAGAQTGLSVISESSTLPFENISVTSSNPNVASVSGSTVTAHGSGTAVLTVCYNNYPASAQEITITVTGGEPAAPYAEAFRDVKPGSWYADAVKWAVESEITSGTTATTFSPNDPCTRAQAVTFLWRAADTPKAAGTNPFTDVKPSAYYHGAVLWAAENDITAGVSATSFAPGQTCTRAQIVTFLWRAAGSPKAEGSNPFADVKSSAYYLDAVLWAAENDITAGVSANSFAPGQTCTRAQIVTFLYRYMSGSQA